jgi:hypothetical protein
MRRRGKTQSENDIVPAMEPNRKQAVIAIVPAILAARKLSSVSPNSAARQRGAL